MHQCEAAQCSSCVGLLRIGAFLNAGYNASARLGLREKSPSTSVSNPGLREPEFGYKTCLTFSFPKAATIQLFEVI
eukprot:2948024-Amphidinium_carterae.1